MKTQPYLKHLVETMERLASQLREIPYLLNLKQATIGDAVLGVDSLQKLIMVHPNFNITNLDIVNFVI